MVNIKEILIDGTFKSVPGPFYQLIVIHGDLGSTSGSTKVEPLIYALLPSKTEKGYHILFDLIKAVIPEWNPAILHVDFEPAITNALNSFFPSTIINRCYFHFTQSLRRNVNQRKFV